MTAHPIDTEALQAEIEAAVVDYRKLFPAPWKLSPNLDLAVRALSALAAAEARATRAETQSAIRGRAVAYARERARGAEAERDAARGYISELETAVRSRNEVITHRDARIKAVLDMCDAKEDPDRWPPRPVMHGGAPFPAHLAVQDIRRALEG